MAYKRQVFIMEYERGWGSRVEEVKLFDSDKEAKDFVENFNSRNTETVVPDWYMSAKLGSIKEV